MKTEIKPVWLANVDAMIQSAKGSTKRRLISLRQQQLSKRNISTNPTKEKLSKAINLLWQVQSELGSTKSGMNVSQALMTLEGINATL